MLPRVSPPRKSSKNIQNPWGGHLTFLGARAASLKNQGTGPAGPFPDVEPLTLLTSILRIAPFFTWYMAKPTPMASPLSSKVMLPSGVSAGLVRSALTMAS
jgi:hypothetical protein